VRKVGLLGPKEGTLVSCSGGRLSRADWGGSVCRRARREAKREVREVK
jgi:hypothetical protein